MSDFFDQIDEEESKQRKGPTATGATCGCGGEVRLYEGKYGEYYQCEECKKRISALYSGHRFTDDEVSALLKGGTLKGLSFVSKRTGKPFTADIHLNEEGKLELVFAESSGGSAEVSRLVCPECGSYLMKRNGKYGEYYYCGSPGCNTRISAEYCGHKFTEEELHTLLSGGMTEEISFISRKNKPFNARVSLVEGKIKFDFAN